ncbi:PTS system, lactose/cellobiose family IIC component [Thermoanaerobacter thermohydrosulfuricus WC1]|uniref:Permease IIC component n=1 Tax=Thermoanaerobacter thermohydrosulfuricus WC1 TaxID=1198630 RepID=M8DSK3_THETY|nr:PTS sugar transporter subunit IIC [Thermoanaerobacter thermohydrosulfuricus]EMT39486.1 PTS system, lactose/cellobiose family IIC component [Thermoanaerobacter thermohydrosulfuricus WC1]
MAFFERLNSTLEKYLMPIADVLANQRHVKAMRDGIVYSIPLTIVGGLTLIVANPPVSKDVVATNIFLKFMVAWRDWASANADAIRLPYNMTMGLLALFVAIGVAYHLARSYKMEPLSSSIISGATFLIISAPLKEGSLPVTYLDAKGLFTAIIVGLLSVEITRFLKSKGVTIKMPEGVPPAVSSSFDALIPLIINVLLFHFINLIILSISKMIIPQAILASLAPALNTLDSPLLIVVLALVAQLLWFVGIHGAAVVKTIRDPIALTYLAANAEAYLAGQPLPHIFTDTFWAYYMVLGGSGATLGLTLLYLKSKSKQLNAVGKVALLPALFNINEPVIFGTPMVLNPIMFIPFVFVEAINGVIAYYIIKWGLVRAAFATVPWTTPAPIGAFLATLDWRAVVLVLALLVLDAMLYYPFFKAYEKQLIKEESEKENSEAELKA